MKISVVGAGYVGLVAAAIFSDWGHDVEVVERDANKVGNILSGNLPIHEPGLIEIVEKNRRDGRLRFYNDFSNGTQDREIVVIAVGTPAGENGHPNLDALWDVLKTIKGLPYRSLTVVVKSTVPVGTCDAISAFLNDRKQQNNSTPQFDVVMAPEFLRQGTAITDFLHPDRIVIGSSTEEARLQMESLFSPLECPVIYTDWRSAEMIKYAANAFLAMKISFINSIANLSEEVGGNIKQISLGIGLDRRIGPSFLQPGVGFGGSCLPKDTQALVALGEDYHVHMDLLQSVLEVNNRQRTRIVQKLLEHVGDLKGKKIAVLGIAFKPNTNDVREAPALSVISNVLQLGGQVVAYDPIVNLASLTFEGSLSTGFIPAKNLYEALDGADAAVFMTEWDEFNEIDFSRVKRLVKIPLLIDGRNIFSERNLEQQGFFYIPVGIAVNKSESSHENNG